jgi:hypothetical protein
MAGGKDMPILIDIEEPAGRKHQRWVFYGALLSMDNVNEETMLKIPKLLEFIAHARKDGGITFYTRFTRGLFLEKQSFLSDMEKLGIKIDPESIVERMGQPPHYGVTKGRVCTDSPVDFHWRADGAHRGGPSKSKKRRIQDPSSETKRDYDEMTMGEIIELIKEQDETIKSQREHIRIITEGKAPKRTDLEANNDALLADNTLLINQNRKIKAEMRDLEKRLEAKRI